MTTINYNSMIAATILLAAITMVTTAAAETSVPETVVTATRVERQVFETPQAVTVIGDQAIDEANAGDTPDFFTYAKGVYMQRTNQGGGSPFLRGLTGKQVLIMVDGVRANNSFYRFGPHQYLNTIDANVIERIEIVRGPASVLYGSDALGGTINLITKRRTDFSAPRAMGGLLQAHYETALDGGALRVQAEGNLDSFGYLIGVTGKDIGDVEAGGDFGEQVPTSYGERDVDLKINYRLTPTRELIFATQYTRQYDVPKTSEVTLGDKSKFNYEPQQRLLSYLEYRSRQDVLFDEVRVNLSYNRMREGEEIIARSSPTTETHELTEVSTPGAFVQLGNRLGESQRLTYGVEYYRDHYDTRKERINLTTSMVTPVAAATPDGATYDSLGIYLQDEIRLASWVDVIVGLRYSRFQAEGAIGASTLDLDTDDVTGSLNSLFHLSPSWNLVANLAQGFRAPNMEDFFGRVDFVSEIPNTSLKPEKSMNYEIGLKHLTPRTSGEIFLFQSDYEGFIDRVAVAPNVRQRQNIQNAWIRGIEAALWYRLDKHWSTTATAAWTRGRDADTDQPLRRIPPFNGTLRLRYGHNKRLWGEVAAQFAAKQDELAPGDLTDPRIPVGGTRGYSVYNLGLGYKPALGHELLVTLANIGDKLYKTHGSGIYASGRNLVLTYRVGF